MTYEEAVAWLQQFMRFAQAAGAETMLVDSSDVLEVLEREHEDAERWRHFQSSPDWYGYRVLDSHGDHELVVGAEMAEIVDRERAAREQP